VEKAEKGGDGLQGLEELEQRDLLIRRQVGAEGVAGISVASLGRVVAEQLLYQRSVADEAKFLLVVDPGSAPNR